MLQPGLSVSNRRRSLLTTDSREVQYLYDILGAINNLSSIMSNNSSKGMTIQSTATGNTSIIIPANTWVISIAAKANSGAETVNIGTTPGGSDLASGLVLNTTTYKTVNVNQFYPAGQTIYITGAVGSVTYNVLTSPM